MAVQVKDFLPIIRTAVPGDETSLAALKRDTFRQSFVDGGFAIPYPPEDIAAFETNYSVERISAELADPQRQNWVVEANGQLLGYAQTGPAKLPHSDVRADDGELYQLYVRIEAQGLGLGTRLLAAALDHLAQTRPGPVWIGVWSGNLRAQAMYAARGFVKVGEYGFPVGNWIDREFILRRGE